jgi:hypothetical protein
MRKKKDPMPGILDDTHPGCYYGEYHAIVPIMGSKRYAVIGPDKEGNCTYLKTCIRLTLQRSGLTKTPVKKRYK